MRSRQLELQHRLLARTPLERRLERRLELGLAPSLAVGLCLGMACVTCGNSVDEGCSAACTSGGAGGDGGDGGQGGSGAHGAGGGGGDAGDAGASGSGGSAGGGGGGTGGVSGSGGGGGSGGEAASGGSGGGGTVCEGDRLVQTQEEFDALVAEQCGVVSGHLSIDGSDPSALSLTTLQGLESVTSAGRVSVLQNTVLVSTGGLDNLRSVGGYFRIEHNPKLTSIARLRNLETVGGSLNVIYSALPSLVGLENVKSASFLIVRGNDALKNLAPLMNWPEDALIGAIQIYENATLPQCEVDAFDASQTNPAAICSTACVGNDGPDTCEVLHASEPANENE